MATNMITEAEAEAAGKGEYQCPLATRDVLTNLKNRNWAFENVGYGPANPDDAKNNVIFWIRKTVIWNTNVDEAMGMRCGNCAAFIQTSFMLDCIKEALRLRIQKRNLAMTRTSLRLHSLDFANCSISNALALARAMPG